MCGGKKSSPPPPAPVVAMPSPNSVADNSNDMPRKASIQASTTATPSFGSELGATSTDQTQTA